MKSIIKNNQRMKRNNRKQKKKTLKKIKIIKIKIKRMMIMIRILIHQVKANLIKFMEEQKLNMKKGNKF